MTTRASLLVGGLIAMLPAAAARAGGKTMVIDGVDRYRVIEPLFECVRVVLSHRGEKHSPAYVQGISGAAFRVAGPCPCAPTCGAAMETQQLIELLGYDAEQLPLLGPGVDPARDVQKVVARVKKELRAGRPAIVWHAFTNAEWDVVCGFDEQKKRFLGRGSYKGLDKYAADDETRTAKCLHICPSLGAILVGRKTGTFNAREAELAALAEAVRHARSPKDRFLTELRQRKVPWRFRSGLVCYEWWIRSFRDEPKRPPGTGDRYCLGVYRSTHRAAAGFLRKLAPKYRKAAAHLRRAAGHFAAEADALDALAKLPGMSWATPVKPDPKRNARAAELLTAARDAYAKGIEQIDRALRKIEPDRAAAARLPRPVRRKDGKVWIQGVKDLAFGTGRDCTFAAALEEAMLATEHPYRYAELMGLSGLAFRLRWSNDETKTACCPSSAVGEMPDECAAISKLTGWKLPMEWIETKGRDNDRLRKRIVASIDAGRPVAAYPPIWNVGVVYGYEDGGKTLWVSDYMGKEHPVRVPIEKLGPLHVYLGDYVQPPALREALIEALRLAVGNWRRKRHDGGLKGREYFYGDAAFAAWIKDLRNYDKLSAKTRAAMSGVDPFVYVSLHDARRAARAFLNEWSGLLDGEARQALEKASELYEEEIKVLQPLLAGKQAACEDGSQENKARLREVRLREIEVLTKARKTEASAITQMEKALAAGT